MSAGGSLIRTWAQLLVLLLVIVTAVGLAGCSSHTDSPSAGGASSTASPSPSPSDLDPVISRVEGESDNMARYENSVVGLRIRFNAATYSIYDDPAELPAAIQYSDSVTTIQLKGIMRNGSMWLVVIPTPRNHSGDEIVATYQEAGFAMAKAVESSMGPGADFDLGPVKVVQHRTIGGLSAIIVERRGTEAMTEMPVRIRSTVVVGRRYTYLISLQVVANGFSEEFQRLDKVLDGVSISDGDAA